jgi:hypothetical protein
MCRGSFPGRSWRRSSLGRRACRPRGSRASLHGRSGRRHYSARDLLTLVTYTRRQCASNAQTQDDRITEHQSLLRRALHLLDSLDPLYGILALLYLETMLHKLQQLIDVQRADELVVLDLSTVGHDDRLLGGMNLFHLALVRAVSLLVRGKLFGTPFPDRSGAASCWELERGVRCSIDQPGVRSTARHKVTHVPNWYRQSSSPMRS